MPSEYGIQQSRIEGIDLSKRQRKRNPRIRFGLQTVCGKDLSVKQPIASKSFVSISFIPLHDLPDLCANATCTERSHVLPSKS